MPQGMSGRGRRRALRPLRGVQPRPGHRHRREPLPRLQGRSATAAPCTPVDPALLHGGQAKQSLPGVKEIFAVLSHDGVAQVLRDGETFTSTVYANSMGLVMGHTILEMDEPEHSKYRRLIQQAFSKKALAHWETDLVRPIVNACIDRFADRGRADLVRELTFPFPVNVIAGMLGLPEADLPEFHRRAVELISIAHRPDARDPGLAGARALFPAADRRAPRCAARRPDQRARQRRAGGDAAHGRRDRGLPAPAAAGRRRDHLPLLEQPDLRPAHAPRAARPGAPGSHADPAGDRGGTALGAAADRDPARSHPRHGDRRRPGAERAPL